MFNAQSSMLNECANDQWAYALKHYFIDSSLPIDSYELIIVATKGAI